MNGKNKIIFRKKKFLHILTFTDTNIHYLYTGHVACHIQKQMSFTGWIPLDEHAVFTLT